MRKTILIGASLVLLLAAFLGSALSVSFYRRWQASKLLDVVRQLHPGRTTDAQCLALLKPFTQYEADSDRDPKGSRVEHLYYEIFNSVRWLPDSLSFPWTLFLVHIQFESGLIAQIDVTEMQVDHPGYPHPNSATVSIRSNQLRPSPADFNGYSESSWNTGGVDENGNWTGFRCCYARSIKLDERATPSQLSQSLKFNLACMTSFARCRDDRQLLP